MSYIPIQGFISSFRLLDILDIALVAFFLYKLFLLLRNTRAVSLIKGLVFLGIITVISRALNLHVVNWILQQGMTVILVALPVVFQPELRRALEHIGRGRLFHSNRMISEEELAHMLDEIIPLTAGLSKTKTGALLVFEREVGLNEIIDTGIQIDGLVSKELLGNIFIPNTPLHDGAVIVRDNKIAVSCAYLPLTENTGISKEFGTRHRAAIGLSEVSDALTFVVSEETGGISITHNGVFKHNLTLEEFEAELRKVLISDEQPKSPFRNRVLGGWKHEKS